MTSGNANHGKKILPVLLLLLTSTLSVPVNSSPTTTLEVDPPQNYALLDEAFNITISVFDVTNLHNLQVALTFNPSMLACTNITVPPDGVFGTSIIKPIPLIDNEEGLVVQFLAHDSTLGVDGPGIAMKIEFQPRILGFSHLNFTRKDQFYNGTYLRDPENNLIPFNIVNGTVETSIEEWNPYPFDATKDTQTYTVVVFSNSTITSFSYNETTQHISFDATGPDGTEGYSLVKIPIALIDNSYFSVRSDDAPIPFAITQNTTHSFVSFKHSHSTRRILMIPTGPGDITGPDGYPDGKCDIRDVSKAAKAFGSYPGHERWDPFADVNYDDKVDIKDIAFVAYHFGAIY